MKEPDISKWRTEGPIQDPAVLRKAAKLEEMLEWAREHGSERLVRGLEAGYDCQAVYREERCTLERPGWTVLQRKHGKLEERANPTLKELDAAERLKAYGARVAWLDTSSRAGSAKALHGRDSRAVLACEHAGAQLWREVEP